MTETESWPRFSIITVTYNAQAGLEDTLTSVAAQTYEDVEQIVIDGGSTDDTPVIIERNRHRIHTLVVEPDKGLYDAMNKGIKLATGDYVCFLNAGDTLHSVHTLTEVARSIGPDNLPDVIYGETQIVDADRRFLHMRRLRAPERLNWKSFRQGMLVCHQAFFARMPVPEYDLQYRFSADFDWCIRVMKHAKTLHNTRLILIDYLNEGITTANHKASLRERFRIMVHHYGWMSTVLHHAWFVVRQIVRPER